MELLKTGKVRIRQRVETTPTAYKDVPIGCVIIDEYQKDFEYAAIHSFAIVGAERVYKFIGKDYISVSLTSMYELGKSQAVLEDVTSILYLKAKALELMHRFNKEIEDELSKPT